MPKRAYTGVGGVAKKLKTIYVGVNGKAKAVKKAYVGVYGRAKVWWHPDGPKTLYLAETLPFKWNSYAELPRQTDSQESDATPRLVAGEAGVYRVAKDFSSVTPLWETEGASQIMQGGMTSGYSDRMLVNYTFPHKEIWSVATNNVRLHVFGEFNQGLYNGVGVPFFGDSTPKVLFIGPNTAKVDLSTYSVVYVAKPDSNAIYHGASTKKTTYAAYNTNTLYARSTVDTWSKISISKRVKTMTAIGEKVFFLGYPINTYSPYSLGIIDPDTSTVQMQEITNGGELTPLLCPRLKKADGTGKTGIYIGKLYTTVVTIDIETLTISYGPLENGGKFPSESDAMHFRALLGHDLTVGGNSDIYHYAYRD